MLPPSPPAMMTAIFMLTLSYANGFATLPTELDRPQRCQLERTYKMIGYNCANLNLKEIPQQLKSNLEIFDLSFNRIRDLDQESFSRYGAVKYLYLFENMIQNIEEGTFSGLTNLEALDLSFNALKTIPLEIFELPVLRNLYAGHNALTELESDLGRLRKPIKAPLQVLGLPDCRLSRLPDFGILPDLWQLNISSNPMKKLTLEQFSPMCHLKTLDLNNTQIAVCSCQILTAELTLRRTKVMFPPLYCIPLTSLEQDQCRAQVGVPLDAEKVADFHQCMEVRNSRQLDTEAKTAWMKISAAVVGCIIVFATILYCLHRRNVRERKGGPKHRKPIAISDNINRVMSAQAQTVPQEAQSGERVKSDKLLSDCD
ncbi:leucine-rich repeat-containing protein 38 [Anopheles cruzii]|uniref:leucine-rich repeat-containing protein 38 n=1 Tax=Anopheles cruzii TaxID=68878 RepID=UPI0022EC5408|nr:leucine-rich repeat-containing protein 38 [Anopheles cruzii]XP_052860421.1 leucine-rich repeat-containing protein 38 [Anopheles cruzii]